MTTPMTITLHCTAEPEADFSTPLKRDAYLAWEKELRSRPARPTQRPDDPGPGAAVLCSSARAAVDYASRLFKDRRIEVKPGYADPVLPPPRLGLRLRPASWRFLARLGFFTGLASGGEAPEVLRARMVACATRLIGLAKEHGESHFVGEPFMIRLLSLKLSSIGYHGPMLRPIRYGHSYDFEYEFAQPEARRKL